MTTFVYFWLYGPSWISLEDKFDGFHPYDYHGFHSKINLTISEHHGLYLKNKFNGFDPFTTMDFARRYFTQISLEEQVNCFDLLWPSWILLEYKCDGFCPYIDYMDKNYQIRLRVKSIIVKWSKCVRVNYLMSFIKFFLQVKWISIEFVKHLMKI